MSRGRGALRVGTSGYQYRHWRGDFYPDDLPSREWFAYYAHHFDCVEINNTFYRLPEPETFDAWRESAPPGFRFALKLSRYATHQKKLLDPEQTLARFLERAERLKSFLGPVLVQLPPHWRADPERLDAFLAAAPRRIRMAVELRDPDWLRPEVRAVLQRHRAALVVHDLLDDHPRRATCDWCYLRFHGRDYDGGYSHQALSGRARLIRRWLDEGRDVWAFFNNDRGGHAPHDAHALCRYVLGRGCEEGSASP